MSINLFLKLQQQQQPKEEVEFFSNLLNLAHSRTISNLIDYSFISCHEACL